MFSYIGMRQECFGTIIVGPRDFTASMSHARLGPHPQTALVCGRLSSAPAENKVESFQEALSIRPGVPCQLYLDVSNG
jgi:hypothetical protein